MFREVGIESVFEPNCVQVQLIVRVIVAQPSVFCCYREQDNGIGINRVLWFDANTKIYIYIYKEKYERAMAEQNSQIAKTQIQRKRQINKVLMEQQQQKKIDGNEI